jgi:hypothetical protein
MEVNYIDNTLGINLLNLDREFIYLNNGNYNYGVLSDDYLLIVSKNETASLFKYKTKDKTDYIEQYPDIAYRMHSFAKAQLQSTDFVFRNNLRFHK